MVKTKGGRGGGAGGNGLVAVAIDKDKGSQNALRWAAESILTRGQTVVLIHVIHRQSATSSCNISLLLSFAIFECNTTLYITTSTFVAVAGSNAIICDSNHPSDSPRKQQLEKTTKDLFLTFHCYCTRKDVSFESLTLYPFVGSRKPHISYIFTIQIV